MAMWKQLPPLHNDVKCLIQGYLHYQYWLVVMDELSTTTQCIDAESHYRLYPALLNLAAFGNSIASPGEDLWVARWLKASKPLEWSGYWNIDFCRYCASINIPSHITRHEWWITTREAYHKKINKPCS